MNTWPWQELEERQKEENYIRNKLMEERKKIYDHFNGDSMLSSEWIDHYFNESALMQGAVDILLKHSYCEKCSYYIGVNAVKRKLFNISVLSAYCTEHAGITTPKFRCTSIEFESIWKQIMEAHLTKLPRYKFPIDKILEQNREEEKKKWDSGYYDKY